MVNSTIIVHGGAGDWPKSKQAIGLSGVRQAATRGFRLLQQGESSIQAVEAAVMEMEDNPVFNAGTGSTLNFVGNVEADAGIMDGKTRRGAGVALLRRTKNPISLARLVMEKTDHALLAGKSADRLGEAFGLPEANLKLHERVYQWKQAKRRLEKGVLGNFSRNLKLIRSKGQSILGDTVGALAIDQNGDLAAADSTGGVSLKLPGRIGDSPILGAGLYADNRMGAATATGVGEIAMRLVVSKSACDAMQSLTAQQAASQTVRTVTKLAGRGLGIVTLDRKGRYGVAHNTPHLCWAAFAKSKGLISQIHQ
ncbi:MAG TPA: isoaspartyl peptidase/L-asparaginase [Candidatus Bathyarchaeia archaeon]